MKSTPPRSHNYIKQYYFLKNKGQKLKSSQEKENRGVDRNLKVGEWPKNPNVQLETKFLPVVPYILTLKSRSFCSFRDLFKAAIGGDDGRVSCGLVDSL